MKDKKPRPDDPAESRRFIEAAKKLEADESPQAFDKTFKKVAPSPQNARKQSS